MLRRLYSASGIPGRGGGPGAACGSLRCVGVFLSATLGVGLVFSLASVFCFCFRFRWHPRIVSVFQASPLCGAAPTFLCRRKEK
ncbi:hypothetical protein BCAR13_610019 [Paraburkholderia caribensis]|nr:hypothetical protein BCAR13_610019 [Paraburkholderia caribensis]